MKAIYLFLMFMCGLAVLNVALFATNMFLGNEPYNIINLAVAIAFGIGACLFGVSTYKKRARLAGGRKSADLGQQTPKIIRLSWRLFAPMLVLLGLFVLIFMVIGVNNKEFLTVAPVLVVIISLMCFFVVRYRAVRRKYGEVVDSSIDVQQVIADLIGGKSGLVWFVTTVLLAIAVVLVPGILSRT